MRNILIMKVGALGDIVRTTPILRKFKDDDVTWLTSEKGIPLLKGNPYIRRTLSLDHSIHNIHDRAYDLVLNMDEDQVCCLLSSKLLNEGQAKSFYGYFMEKSSISYIGNDLAWFDIGLSSRFRQEKSQDPRWHNKADELKWHNRRTYEDHLFSILGYKFNGEEPILYCQGRTTPNMVGLQNPSDRDTKWPMKRWNNYEELKERIEYAGYSTRILGIRPNLEDHIKDIAECSFVICEDSLPMQIAIALKKPTIALFICTSPQEIYGYGRLAKVVSPRLKKYFYRRDFDPEAASTISTKRVWEEFENVVNSNICI